MTNRLFYVSLPMDASTSANVLTALATLLAVLIALFGVIAALWQIRLLRKQLQFDALMKGYDFSRELHSLGFANPKIWAVRNSPPSSLSEEDAQIQRRTTQLFLNMDLLMWEANKHGYYSKEVWAAKMRDMLNTVHHTGFSEFWRIYGKFYPKDFCDYIEDLMKTDCPVISEYPSRVNNSSEDKPAQNKDGVDSTR